MTRLRSNVVQANAQARDWGTSNEIGLSREEGSREEGDIVRRRQSDEQLVIKQRCHLRNTLILC